MEAKLEKPAARCTVCGQPTHSLLDMNQRCNVIRNGRRCRGIWRSAMREVDWDECPQCHAVPSSDATTCRRCAGAGWIQAAPRKRKPYPPDSTDAE